MRKGQLVIANFILVLFIFLVFLALAPIVQSSISNSLTSLNCSVRYSAICLIVDAALPIMGVILLVLLIGLLKRR